MHACMGLHSDKARESLLDAAEELFARYGIDAVSNRKITEHAGTANHSAIAYHFGGREELLRALLGRHLQEMNQRRVALIAALDDDAGVRDLLTALILPWIDHLASLPVPNWRAGFLFQVRTVPSMAEALASSAVTNPEVEGLIRRLQTALGNIPPQIIQARSMILGPMMMGVCAEYEKRINNGTEEPNWAGVGYFFIDSCTGMLSAPVTHPDDYLTLPSTPFLI